MGPEFDELQERLAAALELNRPGVTTPHVVIAMPSFNLAGSLLAHYAERLPALEHRYLLPVLMLGRIETSEIVFVTSEHPGDEVLDYYLALMPSDRRATARDRLHVVVAGSGEPQSVATKLLHDDDALERIRAIVGERAAFIEPWNVGDDEVAVALALGAPINGTSPTLWPLGFKSAGRRVLQTAGVPVPRGREDVVGLDQVAATIDALRPELPDRARVVVKLDDSAAGDGNVVIELGDRAAVDAQLAQLEDWYVDDLANGAVVEELIEADEVTFPSVQVDVVPGGEVRVLATHEQLLGGDSGHVYVGCEFPARRTYAVQLAAFGRAVGEELARAGVIGRFGVDFVAARTGSTWSLRAIEINLRKGGTSHPYSALRNLVPGSYDAVRGVYAQHGGPAKYYCSTDNLVDERWLGLEPGAVIAAVERAGLAFDPVEHTGVVLHMLSCLAIDGRCGLTAIADSRAAARELMEQARAAIDGLVAR